MLCLAGKLLPSIVRPRLLGGVLVEAMVRGISVDGTEVKILRKSEYFYRLPVRWLCFFCLTVLCSWNCFSLGNGISPAWTYI